MRVHPWRPVGMFAIECAVARIRHKRLASVAPFTLSAHGRGWVLDEAEILGRLAVRSSTTARIAFWLQIDPGRIRRVGAALEEDGLAIRTGAAEHTQWRITGLGLRYLASDLCPAEHRVPYVAPGLAHA